MYHSAFIAIYVDWWKNLELSPDIILKLWGKRWIIQTILRQLICHTGKNNWICKVNLSSNDLKWIDDFFLKINQEYTRRVYRKNVNMKCLWKLW